MGRRDHLVRLALAANQSAIQEPVTPDDSDDEEAEDIVAIQSKIDKMQQFDTAQAAVLQCIGFMSEVARRHQVASTEKDMFGVYTACQVVNCILPLPFASVRNQTQVRSPWELWLIRLFEWARGRILTCFGIVGSGLGGHYLLSVIRR